MKVTLDTPIDGYAIDAEYRVPKDGEHYVDYDGSTRIAPKGYATPWLVLTPIEPKLKKYNRLNGRATAHDPFGSPVTDWVYVNGLCPFHEKASMVHVKLKNGAEYRDMLAAEVDWANVVSCVFVECTDGYEL